MFALGVIVWLIGRVIGVVPIFMPLIAAVGFIIMIVGLIQEGD